MTVPDDEALPGMPPPALTAAYWALTPEHRAAIRRHLLCGTPSSIVANWFKRGGAPVSGRTIRRYRASLNEGGV